MNKNIVVIGASAGGIEALHQLLGGLPQNFPATIFIVLHQSTQSPNVLAKILDRAAALPVISARHREKFLPGQVYVAPADYHLLIESPNTMSLSHGPKENRFRPAIDPLFRSAAQSFGASVIGIVLTGGLDDGTAGLRAIKQMGGTTIVQNPEEAYAPSMPLSALSNVEVDHCVKLSEMAGLLARLVKTAGQTSEETPIPEALEIENRISREVNPIDAGVLKLGNFSSFTCPECHGVLLQLSGNNPIRFRCHTGHAYTLHSLFGDLIEKVEDAMWNAMRAIEESAMLLRHLGVHLSGEKGVDTKYTETLLQKAQDAHKQANRVRQILLGFKQSEIIGATEKNNLHS
ncbi:MAG: chemotaxis protein CheB [Acidobacteriota bacterium]